MKPMKKQEIVTGLNIGSSKIGGVVAEAGNSSTFNVIAHASESSKGVVRGSIVDLNECIDSVSAVLAKLRYKIASRPDNIYVNISGIDLVGGKSRGMIPLALRGREVTKADMAKCIDAASTIHLPFDREIVHRIVHNFSIDDQPWIKSPLGLFASRLNCEVYIITADINHIQNIHKCVSGAGYDVKDVVFTGIADGASILSENDKDEGTMLLDMGASLTEVSIFSGGQLSDLEIIPMGGGDIKGDFKNSAEFNDITAKINSKIQGFLKSGGRISSITVAGGLAFADGIIEALEDRLLHPVKMGAVKDVRGDISGLESIKLSTAIGLAKYACNKHRKKAAEDKGLVGNISAKVVDIFNNYF